MKLIQITGSRDQLDDLFAQLRQDFEHDQTPAIEANYYRIEFIEVPDYRPLEFEEVER